MKFIISSGDTRMSGWWNGMNTFKPDGRLNAKTIPKFTH